ncbi:MAG: DUF1211 domain-containing protein [Caulobacter sp.]|nr:DUF1211 domain-containing protein [Caulobacter sp.]
MTDITDKEAQHLHRLILFSDAVFAIAITLLAIEIHPPEHFTSVSAFFAEMRDKLWAYAFSFGVIGINWISHRRLFLRITRADTALDVLNFLLLGLVALLPLGTEMLWESGNGPAIFIYVGLVTLLGVTLAMTWGYAAFIGRMVEPMSQFEKVYVLLRVALLPGVMCGLTFFSLITGTPWGFVGMGLVLAALSIVSRLVIKGKPVVTEFSKD